MRLRIFAVATALCLVAASCDKGGGTVPPFVPEGHNLSADGAFANSYIVEEGGEYCFEARRVDGSPVEGIAYADWIWSTDDVRPEGLVSDVSYNDGYICLTAVQGKGNAVVGAFDADGKVLWSWHLWFTEQPALQTLDNGAVFMDRNLGAMSAEPEDVELTYGLKYQWGRKDPFYGGGSNEDASSVFSEARAATVFNPDIEGFGWTAEKKSPSNGTVEFAVANPTVFIYTDKGEDGCDWLLERDDYLWNDPLTDGKTNYDPCPAGYRVAYDGAWEGCGYWNVDDDAENGGRTHVTEAGEHIWWPLDGTRWGDADAGRLGYVGLYGVGAIWMRTTVGCGYNASCFYYHQGTYLGSSYAMYRAYGESVRCVKE